MLCCIAMMIIRGIQRLFFSKITVRRSKYCLEISKVRERLKNLGGNFSNKFTATQALELSNGPTVFNVKLLSVTKKPPKAFESTKRPLYHCKSKQFLGQLRATI